MKLLLFSLMLIFSCFSQHNVPSKKKYKIQKEGYYVISDDCPEFKRLIKEGNLFVLKDCIDAGNYSYCDYYFDEELYNYYNINSFNFFSNLCIKTRKDLDILFGHKVQTHQVGKYKMVQLFIWTGKEKIDILNGRKSYIINERDSIVNEIR